MLFQLMKTAVLEAPRPTINPVSGRVQLRCMVWGLLSEIRLTLNPFFG